MLALCSPCTWTVCIPVGIPVAARGMRVGLKHKILKLFRSLSRSFVFKMDEPEGPLLAISPVVHGAFDLCSEISFFLSFVPASVIEGNAAPPVNHAL